jgi:putative drug exporter of the RND superfamily
MASTTRWVLAHRRFVALAWLVLTLVGGASAGPASKALSQEFSVPGREGFETNKAITKTFHGGGNSAPLVSVVTLPPGVAPGSPQVRSGLREVADRLARVLPGARIASALNGGTRAFFSRDARTTFVLAYPRPEAASFGQSPKAAKAARRALANLTIAGAPVHLTGLDALQDSGGARKGPGVVAEGLLGGLGALVVLAFVFGSLLALVPIVIAVASIMTCFLAVWALTGVTQVSAFVEFLIALIGLGVAIDYSLLIVVRWREERAHGYGGDEAIVRAMTSAGRAVAFSGSTVAIGLLALVVLPVPFLRSVGYGGMLIPLVSVIAAITLLPLILARFGARLDWPHRRSDDRASAAWTRWASLVVRRRGIAAAAALVVLAALVLAATTLRFGAGAGNPDTISHQGAARTGLRELERSGVGVGALTPIEVLADSARAGSIASALGGVPGVHGASAPAGAAWQRAGLAIVDAIPFADDSSKAGRDALARVRSHARADGARVGGVMAQNQDFVSAVYGNFPLMIALIAAITLVLLARAFRSVLLPVKAVLLNVLSVGAAWGALTLVWQKGYGSHAIWGIAASGSIPAWMPLVIFAFLFGLSMDYEVFILARMREEYDAAGSTPSAVIGGIARTGRLVTSAALILFLAFVSMASGPNVDLKMFATGLAAGILIDATVVRALLVPAAVALLGRWNWWLPPSVARLLRVEASLPPASQPAHAP